MNTLIILAVGILLGAIGKTLYQEWAEEQKRRVEDAYSYARMVDKKTDELLQEMADKKARERFDEFMMNALPK